MASGFEALAPHQQDAFFRRMEKLGFDPQAVGKATINTGDFNGPVRLSDTLPRSICHVRHIAVGAIDEVKELVGFHDEHIADNTVPDRHLSYELSPWPAEKADLVYLALTQEERNQIERAAYAYIFGNSSKLSSYRSIINKALFPRVLAVVAAGSVIVTPSNPLILDMPVNEYGSVTVEPGGQILVETDCSMQAQLFKKVA